MSLVLRSTPFRNHRRAKQRLSRGQGGRRISLVLAQRTIVSAKQRTRSQGDACLSCLRSAPSSVRTEDKEAAHALIDRSF
jgi:hypothetical protein